ncbi:MAG: hypothetical protein HKP58_16275 [Desulfatitalea sp.]|nr:hypothetical protein [Desulfatitalea sp.]NNK01970.1 hypothetical protein [Desulfatitalea sp.]
MKNPLQLVYGIALVLVGVGVVVQMHQQLPHLARFESLANSAWYTRFCFYLMSVILVGGGIKKIIGYLKSPKVG